MSLISGLSKSVAAGSASSASSSSSSSSSRAPNLMQLAMMATAQARAAAPVHHDADPSSSQAATSTTTTTSGNAQDRIMQLFAAFSHLGSLGGQSANSSSHLTAERIRLALDTYLDPPADARARYTAGATTAATTAATTTATTPTWPWPQWPEDGEPPMELVRDIIQSIDLNGDGKIQFNEFLKMMEAEEEWRQNKLEQQRVQVAEQLREQLALSGGASANGSAEPTSAELAIAAKEAAVAATTGSGDARGDGESVAFQATRENIRTVFDAFDADKDGLLSLSEVGAVFRQHCAEDEIVTEEQLKMLIRLLDPSANGFITFPTFARLMLAEDL